MSDTSAATWAETRLNTIDLFHNPIEHGCNQTIGTKKEPKNHTIDHENECDVPLCTVEYSVHRITVHARFFYDYYVIQF
jgi:hypothetical protein